MKINITINGALYEREAPENITLLHFLREYVGLTGTKEGCGGGECGACTVLLDGRAVNSCLVLAAEVDGRRCARSRAMRDGKPSELQQEFIKRHAVQCGFCTPGMVMSARALLSATPAERRRDPGGPRRQLLPLHRLRQIIEAVLEATGQPASVQELSHA